MIHRQFSEIHRFVYCRVFLFLLAEMNLYLSEQLLHGDRGGRVKVKMMKVEFLDEFEFSTEVSEDF
ncbi:MAG: hypothetical protein ACXAAI_08745 [Promethearchaeota archaeon]|jgi:hypothetical protein